MGGYLSIPILALAAALQASITPQLQILGGRPDLVFLLVLSWAINSELEEGVTWAFVGGVAKDLLSAAPLGASALGMVLLVFGLGGINRQMYRVGFVMLVGLVAAGTMVHQVVFMLVLALTGFQVSLSGFSYVVMPTMVYNLVFIWPIYWAVRRIQTRLGAK